MSDRLNLHNKNVVFFFTSHNLLELRHSDGPRLVGMRLENELGKKTSPNS